MGAAGARADSSDHSGRPREADPSAQAASADQQPRANTLPAKSIIPDQLAELPAWFSDDIDWAATTAAQFRAKYPLHNPMGPRYYKNHHLKPRAAERRPPSVFSPAFPPMAATADRTQDPSRMSGPSRTPSGSPLNTPNSSQVRLHDMKGRPRKISQTSHDNLILEATDPWGTHLHNRSPYDVGKAHERSSPELPEVRGLGSSPPIFIASRCFADAP